MIQIKFRHIFRSIALLPVLVMALALASCGHDLEPVDPSVDSGSTQGYSVCVNFSAGARSATRSVLPEEPGTGYENTIDLDNLKILVFDETGILKDIWYRDGNAIGNARLLKISDYEYQLRSRLERDRYNETSKFSVVVLANWKSHEEKPVEILVGRTEYSKLAEKAYLLNVGTDNTDSWVPTENSPIPMFGMLNANLSGYSKTIYSESHPMEIGTINLLRSVAKIEIIDGRSAADQAAGDVEITSVTLKKRNTRGLLTPEIINDKTNTHQVTSANIPDDSQYVETSLSFCKDENGKYVAFVPEMTLGATLQERACIDVDIEVTSYGGQYTHQQTRQISLAPYQDGKPRLPNSDEPEWEALLRNHIYRFTITSIPIETELELTIDVQPYSNVDLLPDFGLERTEDGYIIVRNSKGEIIKYIRPNGETLTFKEDNSWPYLGKFMGVFDSTKRVLVGYFEDGRSIIFNYSSNDYNENDKLKNLDSWEIYSSPTLKVNGTLIPEHLQETFCFIDYYYDADYEDSSPGVIIKHKFTHTTLDQKGRVIEEYRYATLNDFQHHKENQSTYTRTKLADYTGEPYGDKVISYYKDNDDLTSTKFCELKVVGDKETYNYGPF